MLNRKDTESMAKRVDSPWSQQLRDLLNSTYEKHIAQNKKVFKTYPLFFPEEFILATSLGILADEQSSQQKIIKDTHTLFLSYDIKSENWPSEQILEAMADATGQYFDQYFQSPDNFEASSKWEEISIRKVKLWLFASRENLDLHLLANSLLA